MVCLAGEVNGRPCPPWNGEGDRREAVVEGQPKERGPWGCPSTIRLTKANGAPSKLGEDKALLIILPMQEARDVDRVAFGFALIASGAAGRVGHAVE